MRSIDRPQRAGKRDLPHMGKIAKDHGTNRELVFAVAHVSEMLTALKANYYAA